jgi:hypothetical protein
MKLDEFISAYSYHRPKKRYLGSIGGKGRNSQKKIPLLLSPTKGPGQKTRGMFIGPKE